jgi:HPt (histidine-containing phosphotransfer) domain-containing protein
MFCSVVLSCAEAGRAAHKLKGTVAYLGAQPAEDAAMRVEQAAKSGDLAAAGEAILALEHQIELLKKTLTSHYSK